MHLCCNLSIPRFGATLLVGALGLTLATLPRVAWAAPDSFSVRDFGAAGDGKTDDTAAILY